MSYMRGEHYIWSDGKRLHIWVADGYDGWDESVWATDEDEQRREDRQSASGVSIAESVMDEFIMMRLAQIFEKGKVQEVINRAIESGGGNIGCEALVRNAEKMKAVFRNIQNAFSEGAA